MRDDVIDDVTVERTLDLPGDPYDLWAVVTDPAAWLVDDGELPATEGAAGRLVDGGVERVAVVESVVEGERLVYSWWPSAGPRAGEVSRVEIELLPSAIGTRVVVRESWLGARLPIATNSIASRWESRGALLGLVALTATPSPAALRCAA